MRKDIFLLMFLFISTFGYTQKTDIASQRTPQLEEPQNKDSLIYCDNETEAYFPDGLQNWKIIVISNFNKKVLIKNNIPPGTYRVLVNFMITKKGEITNIKANTNFGYGIEEEVIRAIKKCPKWIPAKNCDKRIDSFQQQPITIIVP